jgi:hypothetical protein
MNLIYRGQTYTSSNHTQLPNSQTTYTYRGQSYQRSASITLTPQTKLIYRGVAYVQPASTLNKGVIPATAMIA